MDKIIDTIMDIFDFISKLLIITICITPFIVGVLGIIFGIFKSSISEPVRRPEFVFHSTVQVEIIEKQHILEHRQPDGLGGFRYIPEKYYIRAIYRDLGITKIFKTQDIFDNYKEGDLIPADLYKLEDSEEYKF